jgi:hypothetical protein
MRRFRCPFYKQGAPLGLPMLRDYRIYKQAAPLGLPMLRDYRIYKQTAPLGLRRYRGFRSTNRPPRWGSAGISPRILHIATHGFFLNDQGVPTVETPDTLADDPLRISDLRLGKWAAYIKDLLLCSGLALSGANHIKSGGEDGLLTALEAASLDLWGTKQNDMPCVAVNVWAMPSMCCHQLKIFHDGILDFTPNFAVFSTFEMTSKYLTGALVVVKIKSLLAWSKYPGASGIRNYLCLSSGSCLFLKKCHATRTHIFCNSDWLVRA